MKTFRDLKVKDKIFEFGIDSNGVFHSVFIIEEIHPHSTGRGNAIGDDTEVMRETLISFEFNCLSEDLEVARTFFVEDEDLDNSYCTRDFLCSDSEIDWFYADAEQMVEDCTAITEKLNMIVNHYSK